MILKKIKLHNFRSFLGEHEIIFSSDRHKNVTLVHGENGTGKTTLLNSILWCLFGEFTENFKLKDDLLSHDAKDFGSGEYSVEVLFEWEEKNYRVVRSGGWKSDFVVNLIDDGIQMPHPSPSSLINSILPRDMASYFFFAGEGISQISSKKHKSKFRKAIRDILGFTFAEAAVDDLGYVSNQFNRVLSDLTKGQKILNQASTRKAEIEDQISSHVKEVSGLEEMSQEAISEQEQIEAQILKINVHNASELQARESKLAIDLRAALEKSKALSKDKRRLVQRYGWSVFGDGVSRRVLEYIDDNTLKATIPAPYDETFVKKILSTGVCICGRDIEPGSDCESSVRSLIVNASSGELQQRIQKARAVSEKVRGVAKEFIDEARSLERHRKSNDLTIASIEAELKVVQEQLDNVPVDEIKKLRHRKKEIEANRRKIDQKIGAIKLDLSDLKSELISCNKVVEQEGGSDSRITSLLNCQNIIKAMISRCEQRLLEQESSSRGAIEKEINYVLEQFSRKDYRVELDESFNLSLLLSDGNETGYSDGEELLLNLSFVCALILHAKSRQSDNDGFLVGGTVAPFVVDAPFGDLDNTYKSTTAAYLPRAAPQLVLFLSSSHWQGAVDEAIRARVGKEYILVSHRKVERGVRPEDEIVLAGITYKQSLYGQDSDCTTILEVV